MLLVDVARTSLAVAGDAARRAKVALLADCLRRCGPDEVETVVAYLSGELRQRQIGVGWASLRDLPPPAVDATLTVLGTDETCARVGAAAGAGSQAARRALLAQLFAAATPVEQDFLRGLLTGELRQGALGAVAADAVAAAADVPVAAVRRAVMLRAALGPVARAALTDGIEGLRSFHLQVGRPVQPMLAATAADIGQALARTTPAAVEWKLDGVRIQVHKSGADVLVFTRSLDDITARVPEIVALAAGLPTRTAILDGEMLALRPDGRPRPFQATAGRVGTRAAVGTARAAVPLTPFVFDLLHLDGEDLIDRRARERAAALAGLLPATGRAPRTVCDTPAEAAAVLAAALARGHEGVVVKALDAPYEAGRRGAAWLKVKPRHTLDLVVLAAEWGHGRRRGVLSNLHLGARDPGGGFVMLGKTFKGLTDAMLTWQTARLLELADLSGSGDRSEHVVHVRPELVVEVAFDGVQTSSRYPGGVTLRFARVLRHRDDKTAAEADTLDAVRALHTGAGGNRPDGIRR